MIKNILKIIGFFLLGMAGGVFANQIFWPYFVERPIFNRIISEKNPTLITQVEKIVIQENKALKDAIEKVNKTVVGIRSKTSNNSFLEGCGLILTNDGLIITLSEVLPTKGETSIFWEGKEYKIGQKAKILKKDQKLNLALIKIEENNLPSTGFFNLEKLKIGERVFLLGIFFEKGISQKITNEGIVKSFNENFIKTNIFEKNILSGSPLFNIEGELLGLNTIDKEGKVVSISVSQIKAFTGF